ncbi:MAG TPA: DUF4870 domain-containing protein [Chthoniobacteraceae bacterium]|jgi:hypothetical protein
MEPFTPNDPVNPGAYSVPPNPLPTGAVPPTGVPPLGASAKIGNDQRLWGMLAHLTALSGLIGLPFGNIIGPLVIWLIKRNEMPFVEDQGKESLNFQITMTIVGIVCAFLIFVLIGIPLLIILWMVTFILTIIGSIKANDGVPYRYPMTWRLIK